MKSYAYHEAGHTIVAQHLGLPVEYTTIDEEVSPLVATKTIRLNDYFDEDALMIGRLKARGKESLEREDYRMFYSMLLFKLAGYVAVELADEEMVNEKKHYDEDRVFAFNILNHLEKGIAEIRYEKMRRIAEKILRHKWEEVESLAKRLMEERTVYFSD
ncbi:MAG: hypothetical protein U5P10_15065 [Spirochaetia bacterium]|nr:hypothetical protein [Spirochaetia bacterium]